MRITSSSGILKTIYHDGSYYSYLERKNYKVLKYRRDNFSKLKISASLF